MIRDAAKLNDALKNSSGGPRNSLDHIEHRKRKNRCGLESDADHADHEHLSPRMDRTRDKHRQPRCIGDAHTHSTARLYDHRHFEIVQLPVRLSPCLGNLLGTLFGMFDGSRRQRG